SPADNVAGRPATEKRVAPRPTRTPPTSDARTRAIAQLPRGPSIPCTTTRPRLAPTAGTSSCSPRVSKTSTRSGASPSRAAVRAAGLAARPPVALRAVVTPVVVVMVAAGAAIARPATTAVPARCSPRLAATAAAMPRSRSARPAESPSTAATASGASGAPDFPLLSALSLGAAAQPADQARTATRVRQPTRVVRFSRIARHAEQGAPPQGLRDHHQRRPGGRLRTDGGAPRPGREADVDGPEEPGDQEQGRVRRRPRSPGGCGTGACQPTG